jgi:hypothetical protein
LHELVVWHASAGGQATGEPAAHDPPWHVSPVVQALPSLQEVPLAAVGFEHVPVLGLQVPMTWHWSEAVQVTAVPPHTPPVQTSFVVQALPSLHAVPSVAEGFEHMPVLGLHVPAMWHWSLAPQTTGLDPVHAPPWQAYAWKQTFEPVQLVPFTTFDQAVVELAGIQTWQTFAGFRVPDAYSVPPMKQSAMQAPEEQTSPLPQLAPFAAFDHAVVELAGVQTRHAFAGSTVADAYSVPPMKQSATHVPAEQTSPLPQVVPVAVFDHVAVDAEGVQTRHAFVGFTVPDAYKVPPMKQSATHAPDEQTSLLPQLAPFPAFDHAVVELAGVQTRHAFAGSTVPDA